MSSRSDHVVTDSRPWSVLLGVTLATAFGAFAFAGGGLTLLGVIDLAGWSRWIGGFVAALCGASALWGGHGVWRRRPASLKWQVVPVYLAFVVATAKTLDEAGVFRALDAWGLLFLRGAPFLVLIIAGLVLRSSQDRFAGRPFADVVARSGQALALLGGLGALVSWRVYDVNVDTFSSLWRERTLLGLALAVLCGVAIWALWRSSTQDWLAVTAQQRSGLTGLLFLSPNILGFLTFFAGPLLYSLYASFTNWKGVSDPEGFGLHNYRRIFDIDVEVVSKPGVQARSVLASGYVESFRIDWFGWAGIRMIWGARDPDFWQAMGVIMRFVVFALPLAIIPALFLAQLLNSKLPGMKFFRAVYFVPSVAGVVAVGVIWKQMFSSTIGFVNFCLSGGSNLFGFGDVNIEWLSDRNWASWALIIVFVWMNIGFNTVIYLAGMQGLPTDVYEAADIDGASWWRTFRSITVPMLGPTTLFVTTTMSIQALQLFSEPQVLFASSAVPGRGPEDAGLTPVNYLYFTGFKSLQFGYASAVAWVLFIVIFGFTLLQFRNQRESATGF